MRFALLGDHPDGLQMARALVRSGRHQVTTYSGPALGYEYLQRYEMAPQRVGDLEEVLADPAIEAVIVAGAAGQRGGQLRRALQSEHHVLCVHPVDDSADVAYEAAMLQADVRVLLLPLLPEALHPGIRRLAELARAAPPSKHPHDSRAASAAITLEPPRSSTTERPESQDAWRDRALSARLVEVERWSVEEVLLDWEQEGHRPALPGWESVRLLGGEVAEVWALAQAEEAAAEEPLVLAGRYLQGGLFQLTYLPGQAEARLRLALVNRRGRSELIFPEGFPGASFLTYVDDQGEARQERWEAFDPWEALVEEFERRLAQRRGPGLLSWQDAIRGLELDDAARRSLERRRPSTLDFQEATEEAGFKGTMTLVGCSMIWLSLVLLILSVWVPWLGYVIIPVFGIFLALQLLRWVVPGAGEQESEHPGKS